MSKRISALVVFLSVSFSLAEFGQTSQFFPQFALGGGAKTFFTIHNPGDEAITVKAELYRSDGTLLLMTEVMIAAGGSQTLEPQDPGTLTVGWARLSSEGRFNATEFFQISVGEENLPRVGVLPSRLSTQTKLFGFVEAGAVNTGVAAANPSPTTSSDLTIRRFDQEGNLLATSNTTLGPLQHLAVFLDQDPFFPGLEDFEGTVEVEATEPIVMVNLRADGVLLSAIAVLTPDGQGLTPGSVTTEFIADGAVTGQKIADNQVVKSLNGLTDDLTLEAGSNVSITPTGDNTLIIASTGGGGAAGGDITAVLAGEGLTGGGDQGDVSLSLADMGVSTSKLADSSVTQSKIATAQVVTSLNTLKDDVVLAPGPNITITPSGNTLIIDTTGGGGGNNTAIGTDALISNTTGSFNTASGFEALRSNTEGSFNTANGAEALRNNTLGSDNTAIGVNALRSNTEGEGNTATGIDALFGNTTGSNNSATGSWALASNTTGSFNTATGASALFGNTTGTDNTASGAGALRNNTGGSFNSASGSGALFSNTTGSGNTASGAGALISNTEGLSNTASGAEALFSNTTGSGNTASGAGALFSNTDGSSNTASGTLALGSNLTGSDNTAFGASALLGNTTGSFNTATGSGSLRSNTTGMLNTANGIQALRENTEGSNNTASGAGALTKNTAGSGNTATGTTALENNTIGSFNTANGLNALNSNIEGLFNTASGSGSLQDNTMGINNTASGANALVFNTTGSFNTASGANALENNTTGGNNVAVGSRAGSDLVSGSHNIYVGNPGISSESNTIRIGNSTDHANGAFIAGVMVVAPSSRRLKQDIQGMGNASDGLLKLRPVTFRYKKKYGSGEDRLQYGLIAEEVAEVYPDLVVYDDRGQVKTVEYQKLSAMLLNELLKQNGRLKKQYRILKEQEAINAALVQRLSRLEALAAQTQVPSTQTPGATEKSIH